MIFLAHISFTNRCNIRWTTPWRKPLKLPKGIQKVQVPSHLSQFYPFFRVTLLKLAAKTPQNGWFGRRSGFLLRRLIFRCRMLVSGRVYHFLLQFTVVVVVNDPFKDKFDPPGHHLASMAPRINGTSVSKTKICTWPFRGNVRKHIPICFKYLVVRLNHRSATSLIIGNLPELSNYRPQVFFACWCRLFFGVRRVQPPFTTRNLTGGVRTAILGKQAPSKELVRMSEEVKAQVQFVPLTLRLAD